MAQNKVEDEKEGLWIRFRVIIVAAVVFIGLMLPPVKKWLNAIPYLWTVFYPLLSLFSLYILIKVIQGKEGPVTYIKWSLLLVSALSMTVAKFGLGSVFFTLGRTLAVVFIIVELVTFLYDNIRSEM